MPSRTARTEVITTLTGENSFALRRRLNEITTDFLKKHGELALQRIDADEAEASAINEAIQALPFLSKHKMVVVRNGNANKQFAEQIEQAIDSTPDGTELILYEPQIDKRTAYFKLLQKRTRLEEFKSLDKPALAKWLLEEARLQGATLKMSDAIYLVERVGENQEMLYNELSKLAIYDAAITRENIDLLTEPTPQSRVFDLLDAAFGGHKAKAIELYQDQRAQKVEPQAILAMITWQLQLLALVKLARGRKPEQIAKDAGMKSPYPITKASGLARKLSEDKLRQMVSAALNIDLKSKTTTFDLDEALKTFIATL